MIQYSYGSDNQIVIGDSALRDLFAAAALVGIVAHSYSATMSAKEMAADAYEYADAMLAARQGEAE